MKLYLYIILYMSSTNELVHRSPRVLHDVCLQPQSYTFWRLQQVTQFNWELAPPPPKQAYSTECLLY